MPATGRLDRHAGRHERQRRAADRRHRRRAVRLHDVRDDAQRVREVLLARQHGDQRALGEHAVADLAALGHAHAAGLTGRVRREVVVVHVAAPLVGRRSCRAAGACRGMPSVVTLTTWVSPRWNSAEPCVIGNRSTSADSGRMLGRWCVRRCAAPSSTMRRRTSFLVSERTAGLISPTRSGNSSGQRAR